VQRWPICLLCWFVSAQILAQDPVLARVQSVNPARGEVVVRLDSDHREITLPMPRIDAAQALEPGTLVRVWPATDGALAGMDSPPRITPVQRSLYLDDRTGVRGRLRRIGGDGSGMGNGRGNR
jgi:hypothetical protein